MKHKIYLVRVVSNDNSSFYLVAVINECLHVDSRSFLCELQCLNEERSWELLDKIAISWREGTTNI